MNEIATFQEFLTTQSVQVPTWGFLFNLILAAILLFILSRIYIKYGESLSNRKMFARNFIIIGMTTMFIIVVVKSSLALSLGLVGALSIIRFRTAIKEPEELAYLFFVISIGLGMGADQQVITIVAFAFISTIICLKSFFKKKEQNQNLYLKISSNSPNNVSLEKITEILKRYCESVNLRRFEETQEIIETSFLVDFIDFEQLNKSKLELRNLDNSIRITYLDNKGIS